MALLEQVHAGTSYILYVTLGRIRRLQEMIQLPKHFLHHCVKHSDLLSGIPKPVSCLQASPLPQLTFATLTK